LRVIYLYLCIKHNNLRINTLSCRRNVLEIGGQGRVGRSSKRGNQQQSREERDPVYRRRNGTEHGDGHENLQARRERTIDFRKISAHGAAQSEYCISKHWS